MKASTISNFGVFQVTFRTDRNVVRAPEKVRAMATSDSSIEVWWEAVPLRTKVIGYYIYYSMTKTNDLSKWNRKTVGLTTSADLVNLEREQTYNIAVAARYVISTAHWKNHSCLHPQKNSLCQVNISVFSD